MIPFKTKKCRNPEIQLEIFGEKLLKILILEIISENKSLYKEDIYKELDVRFGYQLNPYLIDSLLDTLWFEEMITTEHRKGKCSLSLSKKGTEKIDMKKLHILNAERRKSPSRVGELS